MEDPKTRKEKKNSKEKRNKELNGKYSSRHIRLVENRQIKYSSEISKKK